MPNPFKKPAPGSERRAADQPDAMGEAFAKGDLPDTGRRADDASLTEQTDGAGDTTAGETLDTFRRPSTRDTAATLRADIDEIREYLGNLDAHLRQKNLLW